MDFCLLILATMKTFFHLFLCFMHPRNYQQTHQLYNFHYWFIKFFFFFFKNKNYSYFVGNLSALFLQLVVEFSDKSSILPREYSQNPKILCWDGVGSLWCSWMAFLWNKINNEGNLVKTHGFVHCGRREIPCRCQVCFQRLDSCKVNQPGRHRHVLLKYNRYIFGQKYPFAFYC